MRSKKNLQSVWTNKRRNAALTAKPNHMLILRVFLYCGDLPRRPAMSHWEYSTIVTTKITADMDKKIGGMAHDNTEKTRNDPGSSSVSEVNRSRPGVELQR